MELVESLRVSELQLMFEATLCGCCCVCVCVSNLSESRRIQNTWHLYTCMSFYFHIVPIHLHAVSMASRCHPTEALVKAQADAMKMHLAHVGYVSCSHDYCIVAIVITS